MDWMQQHTGPVDATNMHEWEAAAPRQVGAGLVSGCWYLPAEALRTRSTARGVIAALARGRALLRYPLETTPGRRAARVPVHHG
jgi:hypothetical protein